MRQADQEEEEERNGREQRVESEGAREKRNVVFVGGLERAEKKPAR